MNREHAAKIIDQAIGPAIRRACIEAAAQRAKDEGRDFISCSDFEDMPEFPGCCGSCHEDEDYDAISYGLFDIEVDTVKWHMMNTHLCCRVRNWIDPIDLGRSGQS